MSSFNNVEISVLLSFLFLLSHHEPRFCVPHNFHVFENLCSWLMHFSNLKNRHQQKLHSIVYFLCQTDDMGNKMQHSIILTRLLSNLFFDIWFVKFYSNFGNISKMTIIDFSYKFHKIQEMTKYFGVSSDPISEYKLCSAIELYGRSEYKHDYNHVI